MRLLQIKMLRKEMKMIGITETATPIAISVERASQVSSLSKPFLRNEIRAGKLRVVRPGNSRRVLILMSDFMDYLKGETNKN
jgi:excisionase family DNA binding protein